MLGFGLSLLINFSQFVITTTAIAFYYNNKFNKDKNSLISSLFLGIYWALWYHLGTICYGALVLTPLWPFHNFMAGLNSWSILSNRLSFVKRYLCCLGLYENHLKCYHKTLYATCCLQNTSFTKSIVKEFSAYKIMNMRFGYSGVEFLELYFNLAIFGGGSLSSVLSYFLMNSFMKIKLNLFEFFWPLVVNFSENRFHFCWDVYWFRLCFSFIT